MSNSASLKNTRKWILFILGFIVIGLSFQLTKKIIDSNPPLGKKLVMQSKMLTQLKLKMDLIKFKFHQMVF